MRLSDQQITLSQLEGHLWESANILRGPVDAADFKAYQAVEKVPRNDALPKADLSERPTSDFSASLEFRVGGFGGVLAGGRGQGRA